jgi:hypothetical protein
MLPFLADFEGHIQQHFVFVTGRCQLLRTIHHTGMGPESWERVLGVPTCTLSFVQQFYRHLCFKLNLGKQKYSL